MLEHSILEIDITFNKVKTRLDNSDLIEIDQYLKHGFETLDEVNASYLGLNDTLDTLIGNVNNKRPAVEIAMNAVMTNFKELQDAYDELSLALNTAKEALNG